MINHKAFNNLKKHILGLVIIVFIVSFLFLFNYEINFKKTADNNAHYIKDLAYDTKNKFGHEVYIKENNIYVPYLVLTNNYNGNTLLLRKHVLDEPMKYWDNKEFNETPSYYKDSGIDNFLSNDFLDFFSSYTKGKIINTNIAIIKSESIGFSGLETEHIKCKIFLLSYFETGGRKNSTIPTEGKRLKYFLKEKDGRIAITSTGEDVDWWLRTPNTWHANVVSIVSSEGNIVNASIGGSGEPFKYYVRPSFVIPKDIKIFKSFELINDSYVYIIE